MRNAYTILIPKSEDRRINWVVQEETENNINMDLKEIGRQGVDLVNFVHDTDQWRSLVNTAMNHRVP
jgi:hypothetical protein